MQGIFKDGKKLIVNGADSDERILVNNFFEEVTSPNNVIEVNKVLDINGDADGLIFTAVNTVLPDITVFTISPITIFNNIPYKLEIQTNPKEGINIYSLSNEYVKVETIENSNEILLTGLVNGTTTVPIIIEKEGYNPNYQEITVTIQDNRLNLVSANKVTVPTGETEQLINNESAIAVSTINSNTIKVTQLKELLSFDNGVGDEKWYGLLVDLGLPRNQIVPLSGYKFESQENEDEHAIKWGATNDNQFILWLSADRGNYSIVFEDSNDTTNKIELAVLFYNE